MNKRDLALPKPHRSAAEIEFVLRNAKRKRGPELMRDLARTDEAKTDEAKAPPQKMRRRAKRSAAAPESRKTWL